MSRSVRRITFVETLGTGGFGAVYLADVHGRDDFVQRLAIKVLHEGMNEHPDIAARQRDEARLLAQLNHDHIVKVMDLTEIHGRPAVLMEYVPGVDCETLRKRGPLPARAALQVVSAAASALDAAYNSQSPRTGRPLNVVHRDIKPANLLVSVQGGLKVLDFGVARADFDREGETNSVQFGTPRFMAPEQWLYADVGSEVDIYALGISLLELLTGSLIERPPLDEGRFADHIDRYLDRLYHPEWEDRWGASLRELARSMLAFEKEERPTAGQVFDSTAELAERAPGQGLRRFASRVVPDLVEARRTELRRLPVLEDVTIDQDELAVADAAPIPLDHTQPSLVLAPAPATPAAPGPTAPLPVRAGSSGVVAGAVAATVAITVAALVVVVLGGGLWYALHDTADLPPPATEQAGAEEAVIADSASPGEPEQQDAPAEAEPASSGARPRSAVAGSDETPPVEIVVVDPAPAAPATEAASAETKPSASSADSAATFDVTFSSSPFGADVVVDGTPLGRTPVRNRPLTAGDHKVRLSKDGLFVERTITVGRHAPNTYLWNTGAGTWESFY